ncbi:hypothetical protein M407DRAFT_12438 [Tulasnella calospora MUT 4182]|uniref:Uncharacterized protein n=1 Tax=Tulasnella calospora MUT 4182 TaxID=1051891 RepID=A0A0C3Q2U8_9AGAM|nr:hypothetical protein M407DRAFT_12438 [Tulasnella calospora MUT 4182]
MLSKVMVAVGLKKKICGYCNAAPAHEGFDYCSKTCGQLAKTQASSPPASGPPRNAARSSRGRGRGARDHGPPSPRMCHTCGTRPVYKNRDYCSRSCSEGIPWNPPASAPAYSSGRNTDNRSRHLSPPRADYSRDRRYSDYSPRAPDSRRQPRRDYPSSDDENLPDTSPSGADRVLQHERQQGRHRERQQGRQQERQPERQHGRQQGRNTRQEEVEQEENYDHSEDTYTPPYREPRAPPAPPPKTSYGKAQTRQPSALTSGSPWPSKTPQPRPRPRELGPYDEPYQSD